MKNIFTLIFAAIFLIISTNHVAIAKTSNQKNYTTATKSNSKNKKAEIRKLTRAQAERLKKNIKNNKKKSKTRNAAKNTNTKKVANPITAVPAPINYEAENPLITTTPTLVEQRKHFVEAKNAVRNGDITTAVNIKNAYLTNYPLSVWIDYWYLSAVPDVSKYNLVKQFINSNVHRELGVILKNKYIEYLSNVGQYQKVLELMPKKPFDETTQELKPNEQNQLCRYYEARLNTGHSDNQALSYARNLFMQLRSYPSSCSNLIYIFSQNGYLTDATRLEKFEKAYIEKRYEDTTRSLAKALETSKFNDDVQSAMMLYDNPAKVLSDDNLITNHYAKVLAYKRYVNLSANEASPFFETFCNTNNVTDTERLDIIQLISKSFLGRRGEQSQVNFVDKNLPAVGWTDEIKIMRMRKAIWFAQWQIVYDLYDHLSSKDKNEINWQYWKARSARELGLKQESNNLMKKVAKDRSFFGFLAAQELGIKPAFNHEKLSNNAKWPQTLLNNESAKRFFELKVLNDPNASIEWREVAKHSKTDEALLMAEWALRTGNANYAILSVVAGQRWSALDYRFPKPYYDLYSQYSNQTSVPISFLYGISRQESMMNPTIKSPVGAVGLMQLMPATAALVSRKNGWSYGGASQLVDPSINIRLGSAYLREMLSKFDNNRILASAAYNAGPGRIPQWKSKDGIVRDAAMFIENIPFKETRQYVQNVILYDTIYLKLLTGEETQLLKSHEKNYQY